MNKLSPTYPLNSKLFLKVLLALLLPFLPSCVSDNLVDTDGSGMNDEEIVFRLQSGGATTSSSDDKTGEIGREGRIDKLDVLVFEADDAEGTNEVFSHKAKSTEITKVDNQAYDYQVTIRVQKPKNDKKHHRLVLIANDEKYRGDLNNYIGVSKENMLKSFEFNSSGAETDYIWFNEKDKALPMYGETALLNLNELIKKEKLDDPIQMLRALAKLDIELKSENLSDYTLKQVVLYNSVNRGLFVPGDYTDNSTTTNTSLPSGKLAAADFNKRIIYDYTTNALPLILAENDGKGEGHDATSSLIGGNTTLVVGVVPSGSEESVKPKYYKLIAENKEDLDPIVRNRHYTYTINKISGEGAENPDDALKGKEVELKVNVTVREWVPTEIDYDLNGKRYFSLSSDHVRVPYPGLDVYLEYKTNYAEEDIKIALGKIKEDEFKIELDTKKKHIRIQALKEYSTEYKNDLTIQLGKVDKTVDIVVPIYYRKIPGEIGGDTGFNPTVTVRGKYVKMSFLGGSHYLECTNLPTDLTNLAKVGNRTFTHLTISAQSGNGYSFYKMISADELKSGTPIQIPGSGRPQKINNPIPEYAGTIGKDDLNVVFELINVEDPAIETLAYQTKKQVLVYNKKPIAEGLRILMIAGEFASPSESKENPNTQLNGTIKPSNNFGNFRVPWLLQQSKAFGLEDESFVFLTNFRFKESTQGTKQDDSQNGDEGDDSQKIKDNVIVWANSFDEWSNSSFLTPYEKTLANYDILIYLRSKADEANELYNIMKEGSTHSLKTEIDKFNNTDKKVFIQLPSKLKISSEDKDKVYLDANATYLTGAHNANKGNVAVIDPEMITSNSSNTFRTFSLGSNLDASPADGILTSPFDLRNQKVNTPQKGQNTSINRSGFSLHYLDKVNTVNDLSRIGILYTYKAGAIGYNDPNQPIIARKDNYLWIGSPYIFDDSCMNLYRLGLVTGDGAKAHAGYGSHFFINMIEWAAKKAMVNKKQLNGK